MTTANALNGIVSTMRTTCEEFVESKIETNTCFHVFWDKRERPKVVGWSNNHDNKELSSESSHIKTLCIYDIKSVRLRGGCDHVMSFIVIINLVNVILDREIALN